MNRRQEGYTLPQILVVVAILAVLLASLGLLLGPRMKARAVETRIKSDLRQIAIATNLYLSENDTGFPPNFRAAVMPNAPHYCEGCSRFSPVPYRGSNMLVPTVRNPYAYHWTGTSQKIERLAAGKLRTPFDPNTFPLFSAPWFRQSLIKAPREFSPSPGVYEPVIWDTETVPSVGLDGSIRWMHRPENWQLERAGLVSLLVN